MSNVEHVNEVLTILLVVAAVLCCIAVLVVAWASIERHWPPRDGSGRFRTLTITERIARFVRSLR